MSTLLIALHFNFKLDKMLRGGGILLSKANKYNPLILDEIEFLEVEFKVKKVLLIVENENSICCNNLFDETIIKERIDKKDFDMIFKLIFSREDYKKIVNFRRINLEYNNKFDQSFYCSTEYILQFDFAKIFFDIIKEIDVKSFCYICGGDIKSIEFLKNSINCEMSFIDPYSLISTNTYIKN